MGNRTKGYELPSGVVTTNDLQTIEGKESVMGGVFLGGGGGGSYLDGLSTLKKSLNLGEVILKDIEDFNDKDIIITATNIISESAKIVGEVRSLDKDKIAKQTNHMKEFMNLLI